MEYKLTRNNLHITDSYKVRKCRMRKELKDIRQSAIDSGTDTIVFDRCLTSLQMEWICHNFLYMIGYERERTKDCDLDNPCDHPEWMYIVSGIVVWLFVW